MMHVGTRMICGDETFSNSSSLNGGFNCWETENHLAANRAIAETKDFKSRSASSIRSAQTDSVLQAQNENETMAGAGAMPLNQDDASR